MKEWIWRLNTMTLNDTDMTVTRTCADLMMGVDVMWIKIASLSAAFTHITRLTPQSSDASIIKCQIEINLHGNSIWRHANSADIMLTPLSCSMRGCFSCLCDVLTPKRAIKQRCVWAAVQMEADGRSLRHYIFITALFFILIITLICSIPLIALYDPAQSAL